MQQSSSLSSFLNSTTPSSPAGDIAILDDILGVLSPCGKLNWTDRFFCFESASFSAISFFLRSTLPRDSEKSSLGWNSSGGFPWMMLWARPVYRCLCLRAWTSSASVQTKTDCFLYYASLPRIFIGSSLSRLDSTSYIFGIHTFRPAMSYRRSISRLANSSMNFWRVIASWVRGFSRFRRCVCE